MTAPDLGTTKQNADNANRNENTKRDMMEYTQEQMVKSLAGFTPLRPLVPLAQINVPAAWYARVVDLIYGEGDSFTDLTVEKVSGKPAEPPSPPPPPPPPPVPYFGKYVNCLGGDVRTEHDVEAVMRRNSIADF